MSAATSLQQLPRSSTDPRNPTLSSGEAPALRHRQPQERQVIRPRRHPATPNRNRAHQVLREPRASDRARHFGEPGSGGTGNRLHDPQNGARAHTQSPFISKLATAPRHAGCRSSAGHRCRRTKHHPCPRRHQKQNPKKNDEDSLNIKDVDLDLVGRADAGAAPVVRRVRRPTTASAPTAGPAGATSGQRTTADVRRRVAAAKGRWEGSRSN